MKAQPQKGVFTPAQDAWINLYTGGARHDPETWMYTEKMQEIFDAFESQFGTTFTHNQLGMRIIELRKDRHRTRHGLSRMARVGYAYRRPLIFLPDLYRPVIRRLYVTTGIYADRLPYTTEFSKMLESFNAATGARASANELWLMLMKMRKRRLKDGGLPKLRTS